MFLRKNVRLTISFKSNSQYEDISCTSEHVFYTKKVDLEYYDWLSADQLEVGDSVFTASGAALVEDLTRQYGNFTVYTLTFPEHHNYFAGELGLLNHNQPCYRAIKKAQMNGQPTNGYKYLTEEVCKDQDTYDNFRFLMFPNKDDAGKVTNVMEGASKSALKSELRKFPKHLEEPLKKAGGLHEWIPVNNIDHILYTVEDPQVAKEIIEAIGDWRFPTDRLEFIKDGVKYVHNKKKGVKATDKVRYGGNTGHMKIMHDELNEKLRANISKENFSRSELVSDIHKIIDDYVDNGDPYYQDLAQEMKDYIY